MEPIDLNTPEMEGVAARARIILEDAERFASGKWVNISILEADGASWRTTMYPARVAAYAAEVLGEPPLFLTGYVVAFSDRFSDSGPIPASYEGIRAVHRALIAWLRADRNRARRMLKRNEAKIRQQKGGAAL